MQIVSGFEVAKGVTKTIQRVKHKLNSCLYGWRNRDFEFTISFIDYRKSTGHIVNVFADDRSVVLEIASSPKPIWNCFLGTVNFLDQS